MRAGKTQRGFTLLELTVALAIFASLAAIAYAGLSGTLRAREALDEDSDQRATVQRAVQLMTRDLRYPIERSVRDRYGDREPALIGTRRSLTLTRSGWANPSRRSRSQLQRVQYNLDRDGLARLSWPNLDRSPGSEPRVDRLLSDLSEFSFAYFHADQWLDVWPPRGGQDRGGDRTELTAGALPQALRIQWTHPEHGRIERIVGLDLKPVAL
ncbi:MAG: type II secretion system minor pseudopilin GspJ [Pseudomonadota bacterium]